MTEEKTNMMEIGVLALRSMQFICISCLVVGFIWSTSDYLLLMVLTNIPVTPISVLLMVYGVFGVSAIQIIIKQFERRLEKKRNTEENG